MSRIATHRDAELAARWRAIGGWDDRTVVDVADEAETRWHSAGAVMDGARRFTFAEIGELSRRLAGGIHDSGIRPGDVVASRLANSWEAIVLARAAFLVGAVFTPILPTLGDRELAHVLADSQAQLLVVADASEAKRLCDSGGFRTTLSVAVGGRDSTEPGTLQLSTLMESDPIDIARTWVADDPCLLLYTSGSEAAPKGVVHTHNTILAEARAISGAHECSDRDTLLLVTPIGHVGGLVYGVLAPMFCGMRVVTLDAWRPERALELIDREQVTFFTGVPAYLRKMRLLDAWDDGGSRSLRLFALGGTSVSADDLLAAETEFHCWSKRSYGSTEVPTITTSPRDDHLGRHRSTDGLAIAPTEFRIVDDADREVPPGVVGEIVARGPEMFVGYRDARLNAGAFTDDGWFRSGDLGTCDADGFLAVVGRKKDIIIRGGENISPEEIENVLRSHPDIVEVAIVAMPDPILGERACAFAVAAAPISLEAVCALLADRGLARFKHPERLELRDELPLTASGKVLKTSLRAEIAEMVVAETPA